MGLSSPTEVLRLMKPTAPRAQRQRHPEYLYLLFLPCYLGCFFLMERLVPSGCDYWVSHCALDDCIPFVDFFVVPYVLWYPFLLAVGLGLMRRDVPALRRYVRFLSAGFGCAMLFCVLFPNGQDLRPASFDRETVFTWLLARIYAADTNTNVLPSMHAIGCAAACAAVGRSAPLRRWRLPCLLAAGLICLSTVLVKQHSVLDVLAGLALCIPLRFLIWPPPGGAAKPG